VSFLQSRLAQLYVRSAWIPFTQYSRPADLQQTETAMRGTGSLFTLLHTLLHDVAAGTELISYFISQLGSGSVTRQRASVSQFRGRGGRAAHVGAAAGGGGVCPA
jgi:hypothetical protein